MQHVAAYAEADLRPGDLRGSGLLGALCGACLLQMVDRSSRETDSEFIDRAEAELFGVGESDAFTD